jgi:FkbM family methyltransferase
MRCLSTGQQMVVDQLSRELDAIEKHCPMLGSYERIKPYVVSRTQGGIDFDFIIYHKESQAWYTKYEIDWSMHYFFVDGTIRRGDRILDLGCNSGYTATWYGLATGDEGAVHAYDIMPWNVAATRAQARLNCLKNVQAYEIGIGDKEGIVEIDVSKARTIASSNRNEIRLKVKLIPLESLSALDPTFIKIDIEGAEHELSCCDLSGFTNLDRIFLEFHPDFISDRGFNPADTIKRFISQGFEARLDRPIGPIVNMDEANRVQGNIFFCRKNAAPSSRERR